ncbi:MAG TPA: o-succinylbenzoate--CoA ligase [Cellulomonas sp.]
MSHLVRVVPASSGRVPGLTAALRSALDGTGPAVLPDPGGDGPAPDPGDPVPDEVVLLVRTSGSTGEPREVLLTAAALRASGAATADRLAGHGRWLLALPAWHVAGLQVIVRSVLAGTEPVVLDGPFRPGPFAAATARLVGPGPRYTSLVPTQLRRLVDDPAGRQALTRYDAVLLGGAAADPALVGRARALGVRVVTTYGMSETCGGCVYDGVPLDGVQVDLEPDGRIRLAGAVLAAGYRGASGGTTFEEHEGSRWLRTSDLGRWAAAAPGAIRRLEVLGRADDVLVTGGEKVAPVAVEAAVLTARPDVREVCVVGLPDPEWGQVVVAVVVPAGGAGPDVEALRRAVADALGRAAAPRHVLTVDALPLRGPGKTDRRAVADLAARALRAGPGTVGAAGAAGAAGAGPRTSGGDG